MERSTFLKLLGGLIGGVVIEQAIPLGRVWSFPSQLVIAQPATVSYFRSWSPAHRKTIDALTVIYRADVDTLPRAFGRGMQIRVPRESLVADAIERLQIMYDLPEEVKAAGCRHELGEVIGISWDPDRWPDKIDRLNHN